jgi:hypothetical protein
MIEKYQQPQQEYPSMLFELFLHLIHQKITIQQSYLEKNNLLEKSLLTKALNTLKYYLQYLLMIFHFPKQYERLHLFVVISLFPFNPNDFSFHQSLYLILMLESSLVMICYQ